MWLDMTGVAEKIDTKRWPRTHNKAKPRQRADAEAGDR